MKQKTIKWFFMFAMLLVLVDVARAASLGPFSFGFYNSALTGLFLLPLRLAGCA